MDCTIYCCNKNDNVYNLVYSDNNNTIEKIKESKDDWACSLCQTTTSKDEKMYQIATRDKFHRVCNYCLNLDYFNIIFKNYATFIKESIVQLQLQLQPQKVEEAKQQQPEQQQSTTDYKLEINTEDIGKQLQPTESFHNMLTRIIQSQKEKENKQDIWKDSPYKDLVKLQSNNVGNVGEELINDICKLSGIEADCNGAKTKKIGGGEGDGKIMDIPIEIKTAHQGSSSPSFQHELGEVPWKGGKYIIFIDIAPECIYLTIFKNFEEETYKKKEKLLPYFPTKVITWRKKQGAFKLDTTVNINEWSVANGHAIKITPTTPNDNIASFIRKIVV